MGDTYTHGHQESVLRSHVWRTAENSAAYLLHHLRPGQRLLDVGCGPGTITVDLARRVAPGPTLGIDASPEVIDRARADLAKPSGETSEDPGGSVRFEVADLSSLDLPDNSFDVVHAHQVLQHLADPVSALRELRRVLVPGGVLAARDADYGAFTWSPPDPRLDRWLDLYHQVTVANEAQADAGRYLYGWVRAAGFSDVMVSTSTWTFADPEGRGWWGSLWADRMETSSLAEQAVSYGFSDTTELGEMAAAWRRWATDPDGFFMVPHTEVLAR